MIVYQQTRDGFLHDAFERDIDEVIHQTYREKTGRSVGQAEVRSWRESLLCMARVLQDDTIPGNAGVAIEYHLPQMSKRIDFIVTGRAEDEAANLVIVELKQWEKAERTTQDAVVKTWVGGAQREVSHPSYQAWSYAALLRNYNEALDDDSGVLLRPCAYLHNYPPGGAVVDPCYQEHLERAPLFLKGESERKKLRRFIADHIRSGDNGELLYRVENGRIRPSKTLADSIGAMLKGNREFVLIDDQKVVYEAALGKAELAANGPKQVLIVKGGPGTGKSVVAVNLLVELTRRQQVCQYVSRNAAPRDVYQSKLTGTFKKTYISNLFRGSGGFTGKEADAFDTLIVDEAHRLNDKSGLYANLGVNQIKELIHAARCTVFFLDEAQRVTLKDIGSVEAIEHWAQEAGAEVTVTELSSQFRCNGSDAYLAWMDNTLGIRPTANTLLSPEEFDFRVFDSPVELHAAIADRNRESNRARVVAGYCWDWKSKKNLAAKDVVLPEYGYAKQWNLTRDASLWIVSPDSVDQVGCIHTCQGLEVDYIGVIVGDDLVVRDGRVVTQPEHRARADRTILGHKRLLQDSPESGRALVDAVIKNTYRTLMTRGMKGCYVFCTDAQTRAYFASRLSRKNPARQAPRAPTVGVVLPFRSVSGAQARPYVNCVPLVDLKFAAGGFSAVQGIDESAQAWVTLPDHLRPRQGLFVAQVQGESMNRQIPNGAWCLFRLNPHGSRSGKVVVVQHRSISDPDSGGSFTIKQYRSEKIQVGDQLQNARVVLHPNSDDPRYAPIVLDPEVAAELQVIAEFIQVL